MRLSVKRSECAQVIAALRDTGACRAENASRNALAADATSGASNTALMTARASAPAAINAGAAAAVIPPIATTGTFHRDFAAVSSDGCAGAASGLTVDG